MKLKLLSSLFIIGSLTGCVAPTSREYVVPTTQFVPAATVITTPILYPARRPPRPWYHPYRYFRYRSR